MSDVRNSCGRAAGLCLAIAVLAVPAVAAEQWSTGEFQAVASPATVAAPATVNCVGGIVNDDNFFDGALSLHTTPSQAFDAAMRFTGPGAGRRIDQVCVCWVRRAGASSSLSYQIKILRADGAGGAPGSLVTAVNGQANGIGTNPTMFTHVLTPFNILTPATNFYVAMSWNAGSNFEDPDHSLCFDGSVPPSHPIFFKPAAGSTWDSKAEVFPTTPIRALGIRAEVAPAGGGGTCGVGPCIEDDNHVCLAGNRFRLSAAFDPPNDADTLLELARAERLTSDTGYFTFFDVNNVEAVVKVLNACPVNDRFWVFAGGLTNVLTEVTVCDKATGTERKYTNPQGTPFQPIQDTAAFATCP